MSANVDLTANDLVRVEHTENDRPPSRVFVVGVDGDGSKTRATLADERGRELASVEGPPSAVRAGTIESSADVIATCVRELFAAVPDVRASVLYAGVAGAGRDPERDALHDALVARQLAETTIVRPDAAIALDDAFGDGPGVLLIAGTGSVAFARAPDGTFARCGGWGAVIGDEGSGAWLGRRAVNVVAGSADGREPPTALTAAILAAANVDDPTELVAWASAATPAAFAALAPTVLTVAATDDVRANTLVTLAVEELVLHVRTLARRLFGDERAATPVALAGGLLSRGRPLRRRVEQRLRTAVPGAQLRVDDVVPVRGAVRSALRALGDDVS